MDLKDIKAIVDLMEKNGLTAFEMEKGGFRIALSKGAVAGPTVSYAPAPVAAAAGPAAAASAPAEAAAAPAASGKE
ncbi:MAG: acetyl-CoA carboxylase, biotin carboxyl carrier protein, partial [Chthoniobacterales bacterium]